MSGRTDPGPWLTVAALRAGLDQGPAGGRTRALRSVERVLDRLAESLATCMLPVLAVLNPATVVIGGDVVALGDRLLCSLRQHCVRSLHPEVAKALTLRFPVAGPETAATSGAVGGAVLLLRQLFAQPDQARPHPPRGSGPVPRACAPQGAPDRRRERVGRPARRGTTRSTRALLAVRGG